jgi:hypothetical protein
VHQATGEFSSPQLKAMWWFTTRKAGVNAVNLKDLLGFGNYDTAWHWLQKLRRCTIRKDREKLSGNVEVDEFFMFVNKLAYDVARKKIKNIRKLRPGIKKLGG